MKHVIFLTLNIISIYVLVLQFSFLISSLKLTLGFHFLHYIHWFYCITLVRFSLVLLKVTWFDLL